MGEQTTFVTDCRLLSIATMYFSICNYILAIPHLVALSLQSYLPVSFDPPFHFREGVSRTMQHELTIEDFVINIRANEKARRVRWRDKMTLYVRVDTENKEVITKLLFSMRQISD